MVNLHIIKRKSKGMMDFSTMTIDREILLIKSLGSAKTIFLHEIGIVGKSTISQEKKMEIVG